MALQERDIQTPQQEDVEPTGRCRLCGGSGLCSGCGGENSVRLCSLCLATGKCVGCAGSGEHVVLCPLH